MDDFLRCDACGEWTHENCNHIKFEIEEWDDFLSCEECIPEVKSMLCLQYLEEGSDQHPCYLKKSSEDFKLYGSAEHPDPVYGRDFKNFEEMYMYFSELKEKDEDFDESLYEFGIQTKTSDIPLVQGTLSNDNAKVLSEILWKSKLIDLYDYVHSSDQVLDTDLKKIKKITWCAGPKFIQLQKEKLDSKLQRLQEKRKDVDELEQLYNKRLCY
jgi:hypothetical protein